MHHHARASLVALLLCTAAAISDAGNKKHHPPVRPAPTAPAPFVDNWGGWRAHLGVSAAIGATGILLFPDQPAAVFAGCLVPGLVRELRQAREPGNGFSRRDMVANAVGCLAGEIGGGIVGAIVDHENGGRYMLTWSRGF